jgi:hypothetical protein
VVKIRKRDPKVPGYSIQDADSRDAASSEHARASISKENPKDVVKNPKNVTPGARIQHRGCKCTGWGHVFDHPYPKKLRKMW